MDSMDGRQARRARVGATMRRSIALVLGLSACGTRALPNPTPTGGDDGDDDGEDEGEVDDSGGEGSTGTASADDGDAEGEATGSTATATDTGPELCEVDPAQWGQVSVCMPMVDGACEFCDDDPECRAIAESMSGGCQPEFEYTLCGPVQVASQCCSVVYVEDIGCAGRPFVVGGTARMAEAVARDDWSAAPRPRLDGLDARACAAIAAHWEQTALAEHASVASFARFVLDLLALGAPPELVLAAQRAMGDEVAHARLAFGLASAYAGAPIGPSPLAVDGAIDRTRSLADIVRSVVVEGCVGETVSAAQAELALLECSDPAVRRVLTTIARDERRHAQLAWQFVGWALAQDPSLRELVADSFTAAIVAIELSPAASLDEGDAMLRAHGVLATNELAATTQTIAQDVIAPCYAAMLEHAPLAA
jgi:hypothetical protein